MWVRYTRFWGDTSQGRKVRVSVRGDLANAYEILRAELIAARKHAGVSQRDVAAQLSAHQQFWSKIESGERRIDIVELSAVAPILGLNLNALLKRLREELDR